MKKVHKLPHTPESKSEVEFKRSLGELATKLKVNDDYAIRAATSGHTEVIKLLLANGAKIQGGNPLLSAVHSGDIDYATILLKQGENIHVNNDEALKTAVINENTDMIKLLISHGANVLSLTIEQRKSIKGLLPNLPEVEI